MKLISWNVTNRCNLRCRHCYRDACSEQESPGELTTAQGLHLLEEMAAAGFHIVVFSGGEPLLREDIFDFIAHASKMGMSPVMGTNGTLITPTVAENLKEAGLCAAAVSIDSLIPERHDVFRGAPHALERALAGAKACLDAGIRVQVNCTITRYNLPEIEDMMEFAQSMGAMSSHMLFLVEVGRGKNISDASLDREQYRDALHRILDKNAGMKLKVKPTCAPQYKVEALLEGQAPQEGQRGCIAGISYASVLPNGDVHICPYAPVKVASILEQPFTEIWENNPVFLNLRDFHGYHGACGSCRYIGVCGGCRARAFSTSGDWLGEDPYCLLSGEENVSHIKSEEYVS